MTSVEKYYIDIDLNQHRLLNPAYQLVSSFPSNPVKGQFCYLISDIRGYTANMPYYYNGRKWVAYGSGLSVNFTGVVSANLGELVPATSIEITSFILDGLVAGTDVSINDSNTILEAFANIQAQLDNISRYVSTGAVDSPLPELVRTLDSITVPSINVVLRDNPDHQGLILKYTVPEASFSIPRDGDNHYIYAYYDNGNALYAMTSDLHITNGSDSVVLYNVWNVNGSIHSIGYDNKGEGLINKIDRSITETTPYRVATHSKLTLSVSPTRIINVTDASVYAGTVEIDILPYNSSIHKFTKIYHIAGNWSFIENDPGGSFDNIYYDNGTDLVEANPNKFIVKWIYRTIGDDTEVFIVYGTNEYTNIEHAKLEEVPVVPRIVNYHGLLVGRIIIEKNTDIAFVENVGTTSFIPGDVTFHNDLQGIQGGAVDDYQHSTTIEKDNWNDYPNRTENYLGVYRDPSTLAYEATITYNQATRTVSIDTDTNIYPKNFKGVPLLISAGTVCTHPNTTDAYFIYFNENGVVQCTTTPWNLLIHVPFVMVYYNATQSKGICFEERHGFDRNPVAHKQQHLSIGTFCNPLPALTGYTLAPSSPIPTDNNYSMSAFTTYDEDIRANNAQIAKTTAKTTLYRGVAGAWYVDVGTQYGYLNGTGTYIYYNQLVGSDWQLTAIPNNSYVNYFIFATTSIDSTQRILTIPSQYYYATLDEAIAENTATAQDFTTLPLQEWVLLFKITYGTKLSYGTPGMCRIENVEIFSNSRGSTTITGSGISQAFADATYVRIDGSFPAIQVTPTKYLQTIPSAVWTINHNMDRYPSAAIRISTTGYTGMRLEPTITYPDESTMILTFSQEFTGAAHLT